jgi:phosphoglycolate phosphatase-like HAD superfamily hydrolase
VADCAIIFDVDGVLLELTRDEEEIFFTALSKFVPTENLSRDWNSYEIRNDEDIIAEILERNHLPTAKKSEVMSHYINLLEQSPVRAVTIEGAAQLLESSAKLAKLGIATANLLGAAKHRLQQAGFWEAIKDHAHGADGGSHKTIILGRAIASFHPKPKRIIYIGDNLNDVAAGLAHGINFIGFSHNTERRETLSKAGAIHTSASHIETLAHINRMLT